MVVCFKAEEELVEELNAIVKWYGDRGIKYNRSDIIRKALREYIQRHRELEAHYVEPKRLKFIG